MASMNSSPALLGAIIATIDFMTRPLVFQPSLNLADLRLVLRTSLQTYACALDRTVISLFISASAPPPAPILAACLATGVNWSQWARALGPRDFDLTINPSSVTATFFIPQLQKVSIWTDSTPTPRPTVRAFDASKEGHIPISKLGRQARRPSAIRPPPLSLAQELFEADRKEESEIFDMISKMAILSPSPIRDTFVPRLPTVHMALPKLHVTPLSSPELSASERSLSPSSTFSTLSDDESITTPASSVRSCPIDSAIDDIPDVPSEADSATVYINRGKKDLTKYLYQGGQSTVLTGGVMLGNPNASKPKPRQAFIPPQVQTPKYRAPIGGAMGPRRFYPRPIPFPTRGSGASMSNDWRRPAVRV